MHTSCGMLSSLISALFVVVVTTVILLICPITGDSAALPSSVTTHTTTSTDDTIPTGGTTLSVQAMLDDAASSNRTEAVFDATRLTFGDTLTITLPTTAAAWTTRNIPLRIVIRAGTSGGAPALWPSTYIKATGVLALGSNVSILGGAYNYTAQFIQLPFGLTVQDGSTLAIEGGTYQAYYPTSKYTSLVQCSGISLTLSNRGTLSISHNTMQVLGVTASAEWWLQMLYMEEVPLTVSGSSILSISHNNVTANNVDVKRGTWLSSTVYAYKSSMTVTGGSTFSILHTRLSVSYVATSDGHVYFMAFHPVHSDITVAYTSTMSLMYSESFGTKLVSGGGIHFLEVHPTHSTVTIHTNSAFTVSHLAVTASQSKSTHDFHTTAVFIAHTPSFTSIHTNSSMIIANNSVVMSDVTVGASSWWWSFTCWTSPTTITGSSRFLITNNSIAVTDFFGSGYMRWGVMHSWSYPLTINDSSSLAIYNIRVVGLNLKIAGFHWVGLFMDLPKTPNTVSTFSTLSISNVVTDLTNVVASDNLGWRGLDLKFTSAIISSSSTVSVVNNSMSLVNVNGREGTWWYGLTALGSPITITTGSYLTVSMNSLTTSTLIGPVSANLVSLSGSGLRELGTSNGSVCISHSSCGDADSKGFYICGSDMSGGGSVHNTQELTFDCTLPSTPWSPSNQYNSQESSSSSGLGTSALVAVIVGVVVGFAMLVVVTVLVCVICCCKKSTPPDSPQQNPHRDVEMTLPTITYPRHYLENGSSPHTATSNAQPVLGVPVVDETPVADSKGGREMPPPYGGGGCYL